MTVIYKDILDVLDGIIIHQINPHTMGAGLALQIRNRYPVHYDDFLAWKKRQGRNPLGQIVTTLHYENPIIIGMCAQKTYGRDGANYTNYSSFKDCLKQVDYLALRYSKKVYVPYKIGCGLAGGNWGIIRHTLKLNMPYAIICKLGKEPK
jgi:O-acetyl-ADP-ribose deacetylase (regulator of RNase III)